MLELNGFYNMDCMESEIARNEGVSRQLVNAIAKKLKEEE